MNTKETKDTITFVEGSFKSFTYRKSTKERFLRTFSPESSASFLRVLTIYHNLCLNNVYVLHLKIFQSTFQKIILIKLLLT